MFPEPFDYRRPSSVDETLELLSTADEAEILAGGQSLLPTIKSGLANPALLIDIGDIHELQGINHTDNSVRVGAMTPYVELINDQKVQERIPIFAEAVASIGDVQVRNRGTLGGNLAHADPASDLPAAALVCDVTVHIRDQEGERSVNIDDFFHGMYATDVGPGELLTAFDIPAHPEGSSGAYLKKPNPASGYPTIGVAVLLQAEGDRVNWARVAANGVIDHGIRLSAVEDDLVDRSLGEASNAATHALEGIEEWQLMDDLQASNEYRAHLLGVYTRKAIETAVDRI